MKKLILPLCLLALCIVTSAVCMFAATKKRAVVPSDKLVTREITVASFHEIEAEFFDVEVTVGDATGKATLTAPDNIIDDVVVKVAGGTLSITFKPKTDNHIKSLSGYHTTLRVTAPYIDEADASLSAKVTFVGDMTVPDGASYEAQTSGSVKLNGLTVNGKCEFDVDTSGSVVVESLTAAGKAEFGADTSGSIVVKTLTAQSVKAKADTSGSVTLKSGKANSANYNADTSGSINAAGLQVEVATASADTSGSIKCNVKNLTSSQDTGGSVKNSLR